jgi:hypothetical protein
MNEELLHRKAITLLKCWPLESWHRHVNSSDHLMKLSPLFFPAALGLMCLSSVSRDAHAAIITYNDRTTFNSNSTGRTDIAFETAPAGGTTYYGATTGTTFGTVAFTGSNLYTIDAANTSGQFNYNSGDSLYMAVPGGVVNVMLPSNVTAVGFDFMSSYNGGVGTFQFTINGQNFNGTSLAYPNRAFFGFTSDTAITSLSYQSTSNNISLIDNFSFGTRVVPTPEPSTYAMMALGCIALCVLAAKRKKDEQAL